jgi:hypothetical protein
LKSEKLSLLSENGKWNAGNRKIGTIVGLKVKDYADDVLSTE